MSAWFRNRAAVLLSLVVSSVACGKASRPDGDGGTGGSGGSGGSGFTGPVELSVPGQGPLAGTPALAVDGAGSGVALFVAGGGLWAVRLSADGPPEAPARLDANGLAGTQFEVALAENGDGHAFWLGADGGIEGAHYIAAEGFGEPEGYLAPLAQLALTALDVDPEGDAVVGLAYYDAVLDRWPLGHSILDAGTGAWRPAEDWAIQRVAKSHLAIHRAEPYLAVVAGWIDHLGRPWALPIDIDRRSGRLTQGSGTPLDLGGAGAAENLQFGFDSSGYAHALWRRLALDGEYIEVRRRFLDQQWSETVSLGKALAGRVPALAVGRTGAGAAVAFVDDGGDLRVSRLEGATWTTELVHDAAGTTGDVSLAFDAGGGLHAAFVESGVLRAAARPSGARGWEGPIVVGDGASAPVLRAGGATIHLVWLRTDPSGSAVVAARRR